MNLSRTNSHGGQFQILDRNGQTDSMKTLPSRTCGFHEISISRGGSRIPHWGAPTLVGGGANPRHRHFSVKTYVKMKEFGPVAGGACWKLLYVDLPLIRIRCISKIMPVKRCRQQVCLGKRCQRQPSANHICV